MPATDDQAGIIRNADEGAAAAIGSVLNLANRIVGPRCLRTRREHAVGEEQKQGESVAVLYHGSSGVGLGLTIARTAARVAAPMVVNAGYMHSRRSCPSVQ